MNIDLAEEAQIAISPPPSQLYAAGPGQPQRGCKTMKLCFSGALTSEQPRTKVRT